MGSELQLGPENQIAIVAVTTQNTSELKLPGRVKGPSVVVHDEFEC